MTDQVSTPSAPPSIPEPAPGGSWLADLLGLYFSPGESFPGLLRRGNFWAPFLIWVALSCLFTGIWLRKVDAQEFVKAQIEASGRMEQIPPDRREEIIARQAGMMSTFGWVGAVAGPLVVGLVIAAVLHFVFRFFYATEATFRHSLTIVTSSFGAMALVTTPLLLAVFVLKGDWNINPQEAIQANLTLLFDKESLAKPLWSLAGSLDLFSLWGIFLLAAGYGAVAKRGAGWAAAGVVVPWVLYVLAKAGLAAMF
jgi:hypothetical protein